MQYKERLEKEPWRLGFGSLLLCMMFGVFGVYNMGWVPFIPREWFGGICLLVAVMNGIKMCLEFCIGVCDFFIARAEKKRGTQP